MSTIVPAILPTSREDLDEKLLALQGMATNVQVDIVDGLYVRPASWPYRNASSANKDQKSENSDITSSFEYQGSLAIELDLMVEGPQKQMGRWIGMGANRMVIHAESALQLPALIEACKSEFGHEANFVPGLLEIGIAIGTHTDLALIDPYVSSVDFVQFMGIDRIGKQGELFNERIVPRIQTFRKNYPNTPIQVDGGVSLTTAPALLSAGVSRLIIGSALWKAPDLARAYAEFELLTERYGLYT